MTSYKSPAEATRGTMHVRLCQHRAAALTNTTVFKAAGTGENCPGGTKEKHFFLKYFSLLRLLDLSNTVLHTHKPKISLETSAVRQMQPLLVWMENVQQRMVICDPLEKDQYINTAQ